MSTSRPPSAATASFATLTFSSCVRRSASNRWHVPPNARMTSAVDAASSDSSGRWVMATAAPSFANAIAMARPMPESPPVMRARLPVRRSRPVHESSP